MVLITFRFRICDTAPTYAFLDFLNAPKLSPSVLTEIHAEIVVSNWSFVVAIELLY